MKRQIAILIACLCCSVFGAKAQEADSLKTKVEYPTVKLDSLTMEYIDAIYERVGMSTPRFKLFKTDNIYNLIKLDTATGRTWQIQYRTNSTDSMTVPIDDTSLLWNYEIEKSGRFDLYPTSNMYTFILMDTETGRTWQVQWSTEASRRFRERIH